MNCNGIKIQARRNADLRITYAPSSRKFTLEPFSPVMVIRRGTTTIMTITDAMSANGSSFIAVDDAQVLTITEADLALIDTATPDTEKEIVSYDIVMTDQTGFKNWMLGGQFVLLGLNDIDGCGACDDGTVEVSLGGECVEISIDGGNFGVGASISLAELNQAVQSAEAAADEAEAYAANAATAGAAAGSAAGSASGSVSGATAGSASGAMAGEAAALAVVADKTARAVSVAAVASTPSGEAVVSTPFGDFQWVSGDQSANVYADPEKGIWVAPTSDPSGSSGAWSRIFDGPIDPLWFGGRTSATLNSALSYAKSVTPILGRQTVRPTGTYQMTVTVEYFGNASQGVIFDGSLATFIRSTDYGPTFYVHGLTDGTALQQTTWIFGQIFSQGPMTVANSRAHVVFDHVYFLNWSAPIIREGCGGVHLLGCASWSDMGGIQSWRFSGEFQTGSKGMLIGASELPGSIGLKGGDAHMGALTDIYGGTAIIGLTGSTSGSSETVTMASTAGVVIGDIIEGTGFNQGDDPNALIPDNTTVTSVDAGSVTLSTAVNLPSGTELIFFRPALEDGFVVETVDGLWVEGFIHSIYCKRRSISLDSGPTGGIWNFRLNVMADVAPGVGIYVGGSAYIISGLIDVHHLYGGKKSITAPLRDVTVWSPQERWSDNGFRYGGPVAVTGLLNDAGGDGFATSSFRSGGVLRLNQYRAPSGEFGFNVYDASGAYLHTAENNNPNTRVTTLEYAQTLPPVTVAGLSVFSPTPGTTAYATNARAVTTGGGTEGAGAGTGATVVYNGSIWCLAGTNIQALA